jgi:hypothetical protein
MQKIFNILYIYNKTANCNGEEKFYSKTPNIYVWFCFKNVIYEPKYNQLTDHHEYSDVA